MLYRTVSANVAESLSLFAANFRFNNAGKLITACLMLFKNLTKNRTHVVHVKTKVRTNLFLDLSLVTQISNLSTTSRQ